MPLTPFGASVYLPAVEHGLAAMLDTWGLPAEFHGNRDILSPCLGSQLLIEAVLRLQE